MSEAIQILERKLAEVRNKIAGLAKKIEDSLEEANVKGEYLFAEQQRELGLVEAIAKLKEVD